MTTFALPFSVLTYLTQQKIRSAVQLLVENEGHYTPYDFQWADAEKFYDACLAARQTQIEYCRTLVGLWNALWGSKVGEWKALEPDPDDTNLTLDPATRWETSIFVRRFKDHRSGLQIDLGVALFEDQANNTVEVGCNIRKGQTSQLRQTLPQWEDGYADCRWSGAEVALCETIDLSDLAPLIDEALSVIQQRIGG